MSGEIRHGGTYVNAHVIEVDQVTADRIKARMEPHLSPEQNRILGEVLSESLGITKAESDESLVHRFVNAKTVQGRSHRTIHAYIDAIKRFSKFSGIPLALVTADDIRAFLGDLMSRGVSQVTVGNYKRFLSSFYQWCEDEDVIAKSPMKKVGVIKVPKIVKKPFSDKEIELLRIECTDTRDRAIFETLLSTGCRVTELSGMNRSELDMANNSIIALGKGNKERLVYFSDAAKVRISNYLETRNDSNDALFVSSTIRNGMFIRLGKSSIETIMRKLGARAGVENCHPHRFRRTMATNAIKRGMPIEQVQKLLGHEDLKTTMRYAIVDQELVATNARRLIG